MENVQKDRVSSEMATKKVFNQGRLGNFWVDLKSTMAWLIMGEPPGHGIIIKDFQRNQRKIALLSKRFDFCCSLQFC